VAVANQLRQAIAQGSPEVVKQFLGELIDRIEIGSDKQAQPYFWVPRLQAPDRAKRGHSRTPVRIQSNHVEQRRFELPTDVSRPTRPQTTDPGLVWHLGPSDGRRLTLFVTRVFAPSTRCLVRMQAAAHLFLAANDGHSRPPFSMGRGIFAGCQRPCPSLYFRKTGL